jgi:hypothetical protein
MYPAEEARKGSCRTWCAGGMTTACTHRLHMIARTVRGAEGHGLPSLGPTGVRHLSHIIMLLFFAS